MSPSISFRWSFDHRLIPGPPLPVWSGSVGATARNCRAARLAITTHMYRDTSKPQALSSKRNGLPRGQGSTPPTSQSVHASIAQSNLAVHTRKGRSCAGSSPAAAPRRCGGDVAVHGRDKYLNLLACGGVALGSQRRPMPPRIADGNTPCVSMCGRPCRRSASAARCSAVTLTLRFGWRIGTSRLCNMLCSVYGCGKRGVRAACTV